MTITVNEMVRYLASHGVEEGLYYTVGGLGAGEIDGIEKIDGTWFTYFSERGQKRNYQARANEDEPCRYIIERAERSAKRMGRWKDYSVVSVR